jgi:hypothetical protein
MKITIKETPPTVAQEREYPKFRRHKLKGTVFFFATPIKGMSLNGGVVANRPLELFTDCDIDGNDLPPLDLPEPLPFPKLMICNDPAYQTVVFFEKYGHTGTLLYTSDPTMQHRQLKETSYLPIDNFTDFYGTIHIEIL